MKKGSRKDKELLCHGRIGYVQDKGGYRFCEKYLIVTTVGATIGLQFEWDEAKNRQNTKKHGIDFSDAWQLFEHPLFVWPDERFDYGEDRFVGLGMLSNMTVVFAAFVERETDAIRVISMRKAKKHEEKKYEQALKDGLGAAQGHEG